MNNKERLRIIAELQKRKSVNHETKENNNDC